MGNAAVGLQLLQASVQPLQTCKYFVKLLSSPPGFDFWLKKVKSHVLILKVITMATFTWLCNQSRPVQRLCSTQALSCGPEFKDVSYHGHR